MYSPPRQSRAVQTEQRFLQVFEELLLEKSFNRTTIQEIAERASLDKGAFLKRFGTKKQALLLLFEAYCQRVYVMLADLKTELPAFSNPQDFCLEVSARYEEVLQKNLASNRAMNELYMEDLKVDPLTKGIFMAGVDLFVSAQAHFSDIRHGTKAGAFAAAQLVLTINYNYALKAMPALPEDANKRQFLIARSMVEALKI